MSKALLAFVTLGLLGAAAAVAAMSGFSGISALSGLSASLAGTVAAGGTVQKSVAAATAPDLVANGKKLLNDHQVIAARDAFGLAVAADSTNQEAQFLYGVTRILALYEDGQGASTPGLDSIREILELSGISFSSFGLYQTETSGKLHGFAPTTPSTGAVVAYLNSKVLPELNAALANLDAVTNSSFSSTINPPAFANRYTNDITVDYADVLALKSMAHLAASNLQLLGVYGLDFSPPQVLNGNRKDMKRLHDLITGSDKLLTPLNPAKLDSAKSELVSFIDVFSQSVSSMKARAVAAGHLFIVDLPLANSQLGATSYQLAQVQSRLAEIKASLSAPTHYSFTSGMVVDLSKFFNSANPVNLRSLLVDCGSGSVLSDRTLGGILPMGLGRLEEALLLHAQEIRGTACSGSEIARLSTSPDSGVFSFGSGYAPMPVPFTISNSGTSNLTVSSVTVKGDAALDYQLRAGTCRSLNPSLAPGDSCTLIASYLPASVNGNGRAYLDIASNDPLSPHRLLPLTAYGPGLSTPPSYHLNVSLSGSGSGRVATSTDSWPGIPAGSISCPGTVTIVTDSWTNPNDPNDQGTTTGTAINSGTYAPGSTLTAAMVSGTTTTFSFVNGVSGAITYRADGTINGSNSYSGSPPSQVSGTWSVTTDGKIVVTFTNGESHTTTVLGSSSGTGWSATDVWSNPNDSTDQGSTTGTVINSGSYPAGSTLTAQLVSGTTSAYSFKNGAGGTVTYLADGTISGTGFSSGPSGNATSPALSGTWTVTDGKIVTTFASGETHTTAVTGNLSACSSPIDPSAPFERLVASAASSSTLAGWSGCDRIDGTDCVVSMLSDRNVTATFTLNSAALVLNAYPPSGSYHASQKVALIANKGVDIYYTLDGSTPGTSSSLYQGPILLPASASTTLQFRAMDASGLSPVKTENYTVLDAADTEAPVVNSFAANIPLGDFYNVKVTDFSASDNVGVKEYCISTSSDPATCRWSKEIPASFTSMGTPTLYAFARDQAGNVSQPYPYGVAPGFTLAWGAVYHQLKGNGSEYDVLDVGVNNPNGSPVNTLADAGIKSITVTGPGLQDNSFSDADRNPAVGNQLAFSKSLPATVANPQSLLKGGVYTFTLTDLKGHTSHRMSTYVPPTATLPVADTSKLQAQRNSDGSYRISWAPVNDTRTLYYRLRVATADSNKTPVFVSQRGMKTYADIPAGTLADNTPYVVRVEVSNSGNIDLLTNRSDSGWFPQAAPFFTPQASDYNPNSVLVNFATVYNRTDAGTDSFDALLNVSAPDAVSSITLSGPSGFTPVNFDLSKDFALRTQDGNGQIKDFRKGFPAGTNMPTGTYTFTIVANGTTQTAYATLTNRVAYPQVDTSTLQAEEEGNGNIRFSWANVNHTGALYYRAAITDTATGISYFSGRANKTYAEVPKTTFGSTSTLQWRVEVYDSADVTTQRNRVQPQYIPVNVIPYDPARPVLEWYRVRNTVTAGGVASSLVSASAHSSSGVISEIRVTGPGGYNHELMREGTNYQDFSQSYDDDAYALVVPGSTAPGLYTITAKDQTGKTSTRYIYQGAAHPVPQIDFRTVHIDPETDGGVRVSWAPVVSDVPLWYQLEAYEQNPRMTEISVNSSGPGESVASQGSSFAIPPYAIYVSNPLLSIRAMDGSDNSVVNNDSQSVLIGAEVGRDYSALSDGDGDGFASNADRNDTDPSVSPASPQASEPLSVYYTTPYSGSTGNPTAATISVNFNKKINPGTLPGNFYLYNETSKTIEPGSINYYSSGDYYVSASFSPSALAANSTYTAVVGTGVKDLNGNGLAVPYIWRFTTTGLTTLSGVSPLAPVTLSFGTVYHRTNGNGGQVDALSAGINSSSFAGGKVTVTGPSGFTPYTFTDADLSPWVNGQTALYKEFLIGSLPSGVYTFTATDANGNRSYRVSRNVPATAPLSQVDGKTLQIQRKNGTDNSYRFSWAPVNDSRQIYYRIRITMNDAAKTPVYITPFQTTTLAELPAGKLTDGTAYNVRVEAANAPTPDLMNYQSCTAYAAFTPQAADYDANRLSITGSTFLANRTDANGAKSTEVQLSVNTPTAVSAVDLRDATGNVVYSFNTASDLSNQSFYKKITPPLAPGSYAIHFVANGVEQNWYTTLTSPVSYPKPDSSTMQAEDLGNGYLRFSWANVDRTGPVYYRVYVYDKVNGPTLNAPVTTSSLQNVTYADLYTGYLGDLSSKQWRVEVWDGNHWSTMHNRINGDLVDLTPIPYKASSPRFNSWRMRSMTNPSGATDSMLLASAGAPQGTLAEIRVTGPNGYSRDLLSQGRWSNVYNSYVLEEPGLPVQGLYTFTVRSTAGGSQTRYFYQTTAHPLPPVDYRTFRTNLEADGSTRLSWAPVANDTPVWYSATFYDGSEQNGAQLSPVYTTNASVDVNNDGFADQLTVYPVTSVTIPHGSFYNLYEPPLFWITASDGGQSFPGIAAATSPTGEVVHNVSHSLMVKGEEENFDYSSLSDSDKDGFASNADANDHNAAAYPFAGGDDWLELQPISENPYPGSGGVPATPAICVTFNKPIDQRTLPGNFLLANGIGGSYTYNDQQRMACLTPSAPLPKNSSILVILGSGIKDAAGNGMSSTFTWNFTTSGIPVSSASPAGGTYTSRQLVTLTANSPSAAIYYTVDGSTPGTSTSTMTYSGPIEIASTTTLKFLAMEPNGSPEMSHSLDYTITAPAAPTGLKASPSSDRVALSWNPSDGADSYNVYLTGIAAQFPATGSAFKDSLTAGWYGIDSYSIANSTGGGYDTTIVSLDADGTTLKQGYDKFWDSSTQTWSSTPPSGLTDYSARYLLTSSGWVLGSDKASNYTAVMNSDGSATATNKTDLSQQKLAVGIVDLSGIPIAAVSNGRFPVASGAPAFPAGAVRYDQIFTQLTDSYTADANSSWVAPSTVTKLEDIPAQSGTYTLRSADSTKSYSLCFTGGNSAVISQLNLVTGISSEIAHVSWAITTVSGERLLIVNIPAAVRTSYQLGPDPLFAVVNGAIVMGEHYPANQMRYSQGKASFNAIAINHILANWPITFGGTVSFKKVGSVAFAGSGYPLIGTTPSTSYTHSGLAVGTVYSYAVSASGYLGEGGAAQASAITSVLPSTTASPAGGLYNGAQSITLANNVSGTIYYSTDGSTPAPGAAGTKVYSGPITIAATTTLKYLSVNPAGASEPVKMQSYIIASLPFTTATPAGGTYDLGRTVSLSSSVAGALIYYSTDGSTPVPGGSSTSIYGGPIVLNAPTTLKFFSVDAANGNREAVKAQFYNITVAPPPPVVTAIPAGGLYNANQSVTLTSSVSGAAIYYTTDGSTPSQGNGSTSSYSAPIAVTSTTTLKFLAVSGGTMGAVRSQTYSIDKLAPVTSAFPAGGTFSSTVKVSLSTSKAATIYYTTEGSLPTWPASGATQTYYGPVAIASSSLLRYFSRDAAGNMEGLQAQSYAINPAALITTATPPGGAYNSARTVTLSTGVTGASIYYTVDGSTPSSNSAKYGAPIVIGSTTTLKYFASDLSGNNEQVRSQSYLIDPVAPAVIATSPANGADQVPLDSAISVTFSKPVAPETLPAASRLLGVAATGSLSVDGTVWTVIPSAPLAYGTNYGYLLNGIKDPAGNLLPVTQVGFKTMQKPAQTVVSTLSLSISANAVISGNGVSVNGLLGSSGATITGAPISLSITAPDGAVVTLPLATDSNGAYSAEVSTDLIQQPGRYQLQAFAGSMDGTLTPVSSSQVTLRVLPVAGYAVMVLGRIPSGEGEADYLKTYVRAKNALLSRGFNADNIKTVMADENAFNMEDVSDAITNWAKDKLNQQPAPLQIILIDHGSPESFYMEDKIIKSDMLAGWLNTLEQGLTPAALAQERYVIIGSCDSGSYLNELAAPGRTIITSTDVAEPSFRGPQESDGVRSGEYFIDLYYQYLQKGQSVRDAFNNAAGDIAVYTRRGGIVSSSSDRSMQNPLVSVDGDQAGVRRIPVGTEDNAPDTLYLGAGGNASFDPTGLLPIEPQASPSAVFLDSGKSSYTFSIPGAQGMKGWLEVRSPSVKPQQQTDSEQLITNLPQVKLTYDQASGTYRGTYSEFFEAGGYDIAVYLQDEAAQQALTTQHLTLFKNRGGNSAPNAFGLGAPADKSVQTSSLSLQWESAVDPDGDVVSYTVLISRNQDMSSPSVVKEGLTDPFAVISYDDGLLDLATYYWQVLAIDSYGATTKSEVHQFDTDNTNGGIAIVTGKVTDSATGVGIAGATVKVGSITTTTLPNGSYLMVVSPGSFTLSVSANNYNPVSFPGLVATSMKVTSKSATMTALASATFKITVAATTGGFLDCPSAVLAGSQATCTAQPAAGYRLKSVSGCEGMRSGSSYTTGAMSSDCSASAVFELLPVSATAGDCDNSGKVEQGELQTAVEMYLGRTPVRGCVDRGNLGAVNPAELQKVINNFITQ